MRLAHQNQLYDSKHPMHIRALTLVNDLESSGTLKGYYT